MTYDTAIAYLLSLLNKIFIIGTCLSSLLFINYVDVFKFILLLWGPSIVYACLIKLFAVAGIKSK